MNSINSISKGVFSFKNGPSRREFRKRKISGSIVEHEKDIWYMNFQDVWADIEQRIEKIQADSYGKTLENLISFVRDVNFSDPNLQTAVLLTGINQSDHLKQFETLAERITNNCFSITSTIKSRDCPNVKAAIECLVGGIINQAEEIEEDQAKLKKKQLTLSVLQSWYNSSYEQLQEKPKLVVMLADFEQFNPLILQSLIEILCSYTQRLPIVLVLGVATVFNTVHSVLPFHITSKITANVFQSESSTSMLNKILDEVILTPHSPFFLSGKSFQILMDIFLFYDYSLSSFLQGYKVFMLEQFMTNCMQTICIGQGRMIARYIENLSHEQCKYIRRSCPSFKRYVEAEQNPQKRIDLINNDDILRATIRDRIKISIRFFLDFFCCLRMLAVLIEDLPRNNLGKLHRELYPLCAASDITKQEEYQECLKLLRFSSKDKFIAKLDKILEILKTFDVEEMAADNLKKHVRNISVKVREFRESIAAAGLTPTKQDEPKATTPKAEINRKGVMGRQEMLNKLKESAKANPARVVIEYERQLCNCIDFLNTTFESYLCPFTKAPAFTELFIFSDCATIRRQIVGAPRASIHNALSNPHQYLQCKCCVMRENENILSTLPDICIAYKLHLECNKFINLYDWLQAFAMVIGNHNDEDESDEISPEIQARFTRATAELQFLGLIKQAKHKTDHVMRMTW